MFKLFSWMIVVFFSRPNSKTKTVLTLFLLLVQNTTTVSRNKSSEEKKICFTRNASRLTALVFPEKKEQYEIKERQVDLQHFCFRKKCTFWDAIKVSRLSTVLFSEKLKVADIRRKFPVNSMFIYRISNLSTCQIVRLDPEIMVNQKTQKPKKSTYGSFISGRRYTGEKDSL